MTDRKLALSRRQEAILQTRSGSAMITDRSNSINPSQGLPAHRKIPTRSPCEIGPNTIWVLLHDNRSPIRAGCLRYNSVMDTLPNLFLVGLMGAGKTTIGRLLARHRSLSFVDSDHDIEARTGVRVSTIFELEGEQGFRHREEAVIGELVQRRGIVLATGGGAVLSSVTRNLLRQNGIVVYLRGSVDQLWQRTRHDRHRPLLQTHDPRSRLQELFEQRDPLYREVAHLILDTAQQSPQKLVAQLEMELDTYVTQHPAR